jgi:hypothetical protein
VAATTGLHRNTITNVRRYVGNERSLAMIEDVLAKAGVEYIDENGIGTPESRGWDAGRGDDC